MRAEIIKEKFGFPNFSEMILRSIYQRNGVKLVKPQYVYFRKFAQQEMLMA